MRCIWLLLPVLTITACLGADKDDEDSDDDDEESPDSDFGGGIGGGTGGDGGDVGGGSGEGGSGDDGDATTVGTGMYVYLELGGYQADCYGNGETRISGDGTFAGTAGCDTEYGWIELVWTGQIDGSGAVTGRVEGVATSRDVTGTLLGTAQGDSFEAEFEADGAAYPLLGSLWGSP